MENKELEFEQLSARLADHPQSPSFARLADYLLDRRRTGDALALCEKGVMHHPAYAAGHLMLGKCYQAMGRMGKARTAYHRALDLSPYNSVVQQLLVELPEHDVVEETAQESPTAFDAGPVAASEPSVKVDPEAAPPSESSSMPDAEVTGASESPAAYAADATGSVEAPPVFDVEASAAEWTLTDAPGEEAAEPAFDPFPTFEDYLRQHPAPASVMTLEEYLKGRTTTTLPVSIPEAAPDAAHLPEADPGSAPEAQDTPDAAHERQTDNATPAAGSATDLESLAYQLQHAKRIVPPADRPAPLETAETAAEESSELPSSIVTQTMAEIYVAQNEFQAAIDAYTELIKKQPGQADAYRQRIRDIRLLAGTLE